MDDLNKQVIAHLSQVITQIAEGKLSAERFVLGIEDNSVKYRDYCGNAFIRRGRLSRTYELELMEVK